MGAARVVVAAVAIATAAVAVTGCAPAPPPPAAAEIRTSAPPWSAPRDAISHLELAGLPQFDTGYEPVLRWTANLRVVVGGDPVAVPAGIGVDRVRAVEAPLHTHADTGEVWVEELVADRAGDYSLGDFFTLWGVRFDQRCLGDACGGVEVAVDGVPVTGDPTAVAWADGLDVVVTAQR